MIRKRRVATKRSANGADLSAGQQGARIIIFFRILKLFSKILK